MEQQGEDMIETGKMLSGTERQELILELIAKRRRISVVDLCDTFSISEATARRDLELLAGQGKVQRVHGGAIALHSAPPEQPMLQRQEEQAAEKARIGRCAASLIRDDETIFLGSGTTVLEVARCLRGRPLTVITNSLPVINLLAGQPEMTMVILGGMLRSSELSFIGHLTEQALLEVRADRVIIGARSISLETGLTNDYLPETMTDRAILHAGREVILVADHTKFGRVSAALLAPLDRVHTIVTGGETAPEYLDQLSALGLHIMKA
jgi:DeoR/GlpR family transcriptional regulator of sugar metabolism